MPREEQIAGLRTLLAGGPDRLGGGDGPVVCLLHGFGANGDDLAGLSRVLDVPREVRFAFPEAPISLARYFGFAAFAWWMVDVARFGAAQADPSGAKLVALMDEEPEGLGPARQQVQAWLAGLRRLLGTADKALPLSKIVLGGFSQGAMLATDLALHADALDAPDGGSAGGTPEANLAGLVVLSGALINRKKWAERLPAARPAPRFQSHGMRDELLPFAAGEALHHFLQAGPFKGEFYRFQGGHEISQGVLESLGRTLTQWLGGL